MVDPHDSFFWQMALRSGLVDTTRLQECWDAIAPDRRTAEAIDRRLARRLVEAGHLTSWQAQQIVRGRGGGLRVHKYVLLDAIGQGGMGRVFLARDTRLNRQVALKVLSQSRLNDARSILRFRREVRLGAQLQHENLVRIYDEGEVNGHCYLVMEYIDGSSVGHLLAGHGPMPPPTASRLGRQVALGLEHARQKGMIHRDVNPYNILVTREGTAKLADLGLAIEIGDSNAVTLDGALLGNYDYISPEQARHSLDLDSRSDIYSLGCTLYHMVAGQVPFPYPSLPEKLQAQLMADPAPLSSLVPGVPKGFEEVVSRMMRKLPEERHQDPLSVAKALEPFIEGEVFASGLGLTSTMDRRRGDGNKSLTRTEIFPFVPSTADGRFESSKRPPHSFFLSSSSSGMDRPAPTLPPTEPNGITPTTISQEIAPKSVVPIGHSAAHAPPPVSGLASGPWNAWSRWSWLAGARALGPRDRIALGTLLLATIVTPFLLIAKPWRRGPEVISNGESGPGSPSWATQEQIRGSLAVTVVKADGTKARALNLRDALRYGGRGEIRILLRGKGPGPIRLEAEGLEVLPGTVTIGAEPGACPTLVVGLSGEQPFLRVRTRANLKLDGLSIRAEYEGQVGKAPPLIEAKGNVDFRRCAFWTADPVVASGVVSTEGPRLSATGCWFGGFKQCLDVSAFAVTEVMLDQCMMIRSPGSNPWDSWAIRVRNEPAHSIDNSRKLILQRCTISGACLLRADDFHPAAPLGVTIVDTAIKGGVLLAWKSDSGPVPGCLNWSGQDNLYDLSRASRVMRLEGPSAALGGSDDSDALARLMVERKCLDRPIVFPDPVSTDQGPPRPEDFPAQNKDGVPVGADPTQVGPPGR